MKNIQFDKNPVLLVRCLGTRIIARKGRDLCGRDWKRSASVNAIELNYFLDCVRHEKYTRDRNKEIDMCQRFAGKFIFSRPISRYSVNIALEINIAP